jgi:hypothetical protein
MPIKKLWPFDARDSLNGSADWEIARSGGLIGGREIDPPGSSPPALEHEENQMCLDPVSK